MSQNLSLRFILCFNLLFFSAFAAVGFLAWEKIWDFNTQWKSDREREHLSIASKALKQPLWNFDVATMEATLESFVQSESSDVIAVQVKDANGKILMEKTIPSLQKKSFNDLFLDKTNHRISQKISADGQDLGHVEMLMNTERLERAVRSLFGWYFVFLVGFAAFCTILFSLLWNRWLQRPLARTRHVVESKGWQSQQAQSVIKTLPNEMQLLLAKLQPSVGMAQSPAPRILQVVRPRDKESEGHTAESGTLARSSMSHSTQDAPSSSVRDVVHILRKECSSRLENLKIVWTCEDGDWDLPLSRSDLGVLLRSVLEQSIDSLNLSSSREKWIRWTIRTKGDRWILSIHESRVGVPVLRPELRIVAERLMGDVRANPRSTTSHWLVVLPIVSESHEAV